MLGVCGSQGVRIGQVSNDVGSVWGVCGSQGGQVKTRQ